MCARYIILGETENYIQLFHLDGKETEMSLLSQLRRNKILPGIYIPVMISINPVIVKFMKWGFIPSWIKEKKYAPINARAEGDLNPENLLTYAGPFGIFSKPYYRNSIATKRCLIPASAFVEGPTDKGLSEPYLIYLKERKLFYMAGIFDEWVDKITGEVIQTVTIITTSGNELMRKFGHVRMPVIFEEGMENAWLQAKTEREVAAFFKQYPAEKMNGFPISPAYKNPKTDSIEELKPIRETLYPENHPHIFDTILLGH